MGVVHRAWDEQLGRWVAIKMILRGASAETRQRFAREARTAAGLRHPAIVGIHQVGEHLGLPYIVMDLIEGRSLDVVVKHDAPSPRRGAELVRELADALAHAHAAGVLHRDVKPDNVLVDADGRPHLTDFGLARELTDEAALTETGAFLGTAGFAAPEQVRGEPAGPPADVFALGAVLYNLITGARPFPGDTLPQVIIQSLRRDPIPPSRLDESIPPELDRIVLRCLEKDPARRFADAGALVRALDRFLSGRASSSVAATRRGWSPVAILVATAIALALAGGAVVAAVTRRGTADRGTSGSAVQGAETGDGRRAPGDARVTPAGGEAGAGLPAVAALLDDAAGGRLATDEARGVAVFELVGHGDAAVPSLVDRHDARTVELVAVRERILATARLPDAEERAAGEGEIVGLVDVLERTRHRSVEETIATSDRLAQVLKEARRRVERREARGGRRVTIRTIFASAQESRLGQAGFDEARLCAEALGRILEGRGVDDVEPSVELARAIEALGRFILALDDSARAIAAGEALCRIGGSLAAWSVVVGGDHFGFASRYWATMDRILPREAGVAPLRGDSSKAYLIRALGRIAGDDYEGAIADASIAIAKDPGRALGYNMRAVARLQSGDPSGAIVDLDRALELQPGYVRALCNRAQAHLDRDDPSSAARDVERAVALAPSDPQAWLFLGTARRRLKDYAGAVRELDVSIGLDDGNAFAFQQRGLAIRRLGELDRAILDLDRAIAIDPTRGRFYADRAQIQRLRGDVQRAIDDAIHATELAPDDAFSWAELGRSRLARDPDAAIADLSKALELAPHEAIFWSDRGAARMERRDLEGALQDLDRSVELDPNRADSRSNRGLARRHTGDLRGALDDLDAALRIEPDHRSSLGNRVLVKLDLGDVSGALVDVATGLAIAPNDMTLNNYQGQAFSRLGRWKDAEAAYARVIAIAPLESDGWINRAGIRVKIGDLAGAIADAARAIELEPNEPGGYTNRALAHAAGKDWAAAIADYSRALEREPGHPMILHNRGMAHRDAGHLEKAIADFTHTLELYPRHPHALKNRAFARLQLGDLAGARADLRRFLEESPRHPEAARARAALQRLEGAGGGGDAR